MQSWDTAISDEPTAAYSACTTWGVWGEKSDDELFRMMLLSSWRGRVGYPELRSRAQRLAKDYNQNKKIILELDLTSVLLCPLCQTDCQNQVKDKFKKKINFLF